MSNKNNKYLVQGSILGVASIISRFIGMLYRIPLTRIIGNEGMGTYSAAFEWYSLALLLSSYSIPLAVSKLVAAREINKEYKNSYNIFKTAMIISASVGALMCAVVFFGAGVWAKIARYPSIEMPLKILAPTIFVMSIMGVLRGLFQGKRTMIPTAISQLLEQIINAGVSVGAAYLLMKEHNASAEITTYGAAGSTLGTLMGAIFGLMFLIFIFLLNRPILKKRVHKDKSENVERFGDAAKAILLTALPVIISQTAFQITGVIDTNIWGIYADKFNITDELKKSMLGIYSGQYRLLTNVPVALATALGTAIVPTLSALYARNNVEEIKKKITHSIKFNMLIAFPSTVGLGVLAKPIIVMLFGNQGDVNLSANAMRLGCVAVVCFALSTMSNGILQGIDKMKIPVRHAFISIAIHIPLLAVLLFVFHTGLYGLVISNVIFALVICILNWIRIAKSLDYQQEVKKTFVYPLIASLIMGAATILVYTLVHAIIPSNTLSVIIAMGVAVVVYGVTILLMKTMDEDELLEMPKGAMILRIAKKFHLM
ncbi:MAG: polysaccharide biosynthesis protein [Clostridiales bacterium]|nr:polysaccharide biosynthesis protein [Clostridiales bacterium]